MMRAKRAFVLAAIVVASGVASLVVPARAHHAEAPFYDLDRNVEIRGTVTKWQFRNPHPFLFVEVTDEKGAKTEWVVEFVGPVRLAKLGWSAKTFTPGEIVTVAGHPSRAPGTYGISSARVARADGTVIPGSGRGGPNQVVGAGAPQP
jgi:DNA/RNA endonuclease YhcR with UshA esterase domain